MTLTQLKSPQEVDTFLKQPLCAIFKAGTCHKTTQGFSVIESFLRHYDLPMGYIRVTEERPASNHVATLSGVVHHSPQFILFKDGKAIFDIDNWSITAHALEPIFRQHVPERHASGGHVRGNLDAYTQLIESYLSGGLTDAQFQKKYVETFRYDASLRSKEEFELLSGLFGDPDAPHGGLHQLVPAGEFPNMKDTAQRLLSQLKAL